jgi:hypothetical protein
VQAAKAAVAVAGCIVALLLVVERTMATIKQVSDSIVDSSSFLDLRRAHRDKLGLQHEVRTCQLRSWASASAPQQCVVLVCFAVLGNVFNHSILAAPEGI